MEKWSRLSSASAVLAVRVGALFSGQDRTAPMGSRKEGIETKMIGENEDIQKRRDRPAWSSG